MADCLYKENTDCISIPLDSLCAHCRIRLIATDALFASIDWQQTNEFVMVEKSCHTCKYGVYENQEAFNQAVSLICEKMMEARYNAEVVDPKRYFCKKWKQRDMYEDI
jgi:hypothetical protein